MSAAVGYPGYMIMHVIHLAAGTEQRHLEETERPLEEPRERHLEALQVRQLRACGYSHRLGQNSILSTVITILPGLHDNPEEKAEIRGDHRGGLDFISGFYILHTIPTRPVM